MTGDVSCASAAIRSTAARASGWSLIDLTPPGSVSVIVALPWLRERIAILDALVDLPVIVHIHRLDGFVHQRVVIMLTVLADHQQVVVIVLVLTDHIVLGCH